MKKTIPSLICLLFALGACSQNKPIPMEINRDTLKSIWMGSDSDNVESIRLHYCHQWYSDKVKPTVELPTSYLVYYSRSAPCGKMCKDPEYIYTWYSYEVRTWWKDTGWDFGDYEPGGEHGHIPFKIKVLYWMELPEAP